MNLALPSHVRSSAAAASPFTAGRSARVPTQPFEVRLGSEFGRLLNVSATGALLRTHTPFQIGRQCPLYLNVPDAPVTLLVRIVRAERAAPHASGGDPAEAHYLIGVMYTEFPPSAKRAISRLCGLAFAEHEPLPNLG